MMERMMTIKVAKEGYAGTCHTSYGIMFINGTLHQLVQPVNSNEPLWIPVRSYDGPVEHVDKHGRPIPTTTAPGVPA